MIDFNVRGLDTFREFISSFTKGVRGKVTEAIAEWLVGNSSHGLRHYPPYKYVTRRSAFGRSFASDKQRRYVMAKIREGDINPGFPHRTGRLQRGWIVQKEGVNSRISNSERHAEYVMGVGTQSRHEAKAGWRDVSRVIGDNIKGALRHVDAKLKEWERSLANR